MSRYRAILKVRAFEDGIAQPIRERRHFHVVDRPFVFAYVHMAGEPFTLWAALYGRDRDDPHWTFAPEPRDREQQRAAYLEFAEVLNAEVSNAVHHDLEPLQLWVSNAGAGANLARLSRVMRMPEVPDEMSLAGAYLDLYAQALNSPGSALCVAATQALSGLRVTGQSDLEDANLAAQLVWWNTAHLAVLDDRITKRAARAMSAFDAARAAEKLPMGTLTSPEVDEKTLDPLLNRLNAAKRDGRRDQKTERLLADALYQSVLPIWNAIWIAHDETLSTRPTSSAPADWVEDGRSFRWQYDYLHDGGKLRFVDSPMRAARLLAKWETRNADAVRASVCEDRLALVEAILDNTAVGGKVVSVEWVTSGKRQHPYITLEVADTELTADTKVWWRDNLAVSGEVEEVEEIGGKVRLTIHITAGMTKHTMPAKGAWAAFITQEPGFPIQPKMPTTLPWSHVAPVQEVDDDDE